MNPAGHFSISKHVNGSKTKGVAIALLGVLAVTPLSGCAILEHFGEGHRGAANKIQLTPEDGPLLLDRRAIDKYTCAPRVKVCTQIGTTRLSCECAK
jgi:hypothetical protein